MTGLQALFLSLNAAITATAATAAATAAAPAANTAATAVATAAVALSRLSCLVLATSRPFWRRRSPGCVPKLTCVGWRC